MPEYILEVRHLSKMYKDGLEAVRDISFSIKKDETVGLLGPNGAGKTSTISMILGVLEPTSGEIDIFGKSLARSRTEILSRMNFTATYTFLPGNLTVSQNLYIFSLLYAVSHPRERVKELLHEFDLERYADTKTGVLSSGELSRVNLAKALLNEPELLLLDEPTASLDPSSADIMRKKIKAYQEERSGVGIVWTSHNMNEIEEVCDRVLFISHGKILLDGNPRTLPQEHGKKNLEELFIAVAREPLALQ